jgi:hypothetical protein
MKLRRVLAILIGTALITIISIGGFFKSSLSVIPASALAQENPLPTTDRLQTGLSLINQVNQAGYERSRNSLVDIAPDFIRLGIEFPYGEAMFYRAQDLI